MPVKQEIVLELFDRHADMVYRVALSVLRDPREAEDAVQSIFLKLLERDVEVYPGKERAFLTKMTVNHCKNVLSAVKRRDIVPLDDAVLLVQPEDREVFQAVIGDCPAFARWFLCRLHAAPPGQNDFKTTDREVLTWIRT